MTTVTRFVKQTKQPYGGFLPIKLFSKRDFVSEKDLNDFSKENVHASIVGMAVDYLTRFKISDDVEEAFTISVQGAFLAGKLERAEELLAEIEGGTWSKAIVAACELVSYDVVYRTGMYREPNEKKIPNKETIANIDEMVSRTLKYISLQGDSVRYGITFDIHSETCKITKGDCDFLTENTLIDLKVSKKAPTSKESMQVLIYYLLGKMPELKRQGFKDIEYLSFFNPRLNKEWKIAVKDIASSTLEDVSDLLTC